MRISLKEYRLPMLATYLLATICCIIYSYIISTNTLVEYKLELWIWGSELITYFLPIIAVAPFSFILYGKLKQDFIKYAAIRKSRRVILAGEIVQAMLAVIITVFSIYFTSLLIIMFFIEPASWGIRNNLGNYPFGEFQVASPILFGFIWSLWMGFVASLFILFSSVLAMNIDNYFVITLFPVAYFHCENLITGLFRIPQISIVTSAVLNRLQPKAMNTYTYLIGVCIFAVVIIVTNKILTIRKEMLYDRD